MKKLWINKAKYFKRNKKLIIYTLLLFIITRIILTIAALWATKYVLVDYRYLRTNSYSSIQFLDIWGQWDSGWYLNIARHGYFELGRSGLTGSACCNILNDAYFPLYPILMRYLGFVIGDFFYAGLIISNSTFLLSCFLLYELVKKKYGSMVAKRSLTYFILLPVSFLFSAALSESLFLFLMLLAFYFAERKQWFVSGVASFFMALTRFLGFLIVIPLLYMYFKDMQFDFKKIKFDVLNLFLSLLAPLVYFVYLYVLTGSFFTYFVAEKIGWRVGMANPLGSVSQILSYMFGNSILNYNIMFLYALLFTLFILVSVWTLEKQYLLISLLLILVPWFGGPQAIISIPRYTAVIFPVAIILGRLKVRSYVYGLFIFYAFLLQVYFMMFWANQLMVI